MLRHEVETLKQQLSRTQAEKQQADGDLVSVRKECRQTKVTVGNVQYSAFYVCYVSLCVHSIQESLEDCKEKLGKEIKSSKILQKQLEEKQVRTVEEYLWMCLRNHMLNNMTFWCSLFNQPSTQKGILCGTVASSLSKIMRLTIGL